jgi:hypothetical protein
MVRAKGRAGEIMLIFNEQARAITSCIKITPIAPLIAEAHMIPAMVFLLRDWWAYQKSIKQEVLYPNLS